MADHFELISTHHQAYWQVDAHYSTFFIFLRTKMNVQEKEQHAMFLSTHQILVSQRYQYFHSSHFYSLTFFLSVIFAHLFSLNILVFVFPSFFQNSGI